MIVAKPSGDEIVVRLAPSRRGSSLESSSWSYRDQESTKAYDAFIYTQLPLEGLSPLDPDLAGACEPFMDTPCISVEKVVVRWGKYQDYLGAFVDGTKDPTRMRFSLLQALSPGLERLFSGQPLADRPVRIWWYSETPELEDLPWELIAYQFASLAAGLSFVRGRPSSLPVPKVPLGPDAPLRLAYIHNPAITSYDLDQALHNLPPEIQLFEFTDEPRRALENAAREGFELVHLVADGVVSLAYEGILYLSADAPASETGLLYAGDLSRTLNGSRVSLLSLSEPAGPNPDLVQIGRYQVPSAYRAFAYLAHSPRSLPSMVLPLGPHDPYVLHNFWADFYKCLVDSLSVEEAMSKARLAASNAMALFLRQNESKTFQRLDATEQAPAIDPSQTRSVLQQSHDTVDRLEQLKKKHGTLPPSIEKFIDEEGQRQKGMESELNEWTGRGEARP
jgi:hypothetical protein